MIYLIRQSYRPDGGAEKAVLDYAKAFEDLGWKYGIVSDERSFWPRGAQNRSFLGKQFVLPNLGINKFRCDAAELIAENPQHIFQAHDWIPGAQVVRLGDGLHSTWLKILNHRSSWLVSKFRSLRALHKQKIAAQVSTLMHPNLKCIIVNSEFVRCDLVDQYPMLRNKIVLIRNVVVPQRYSKIAVPKKRVFGFMGSGWSRKGLEFVLRALALIPDADLIVAGRDSRLSKYKAIAEKLGISHRIYWAGIVSEPYGFYRKISALIHPALYDPAPNVVMECMAVGCPVVVSENTGAVDFKSVSGVIVSEVSPKELADNMLVAASLTIGERNELVALARQFDRAYLMRKIAELYESMG